MFLTPKNPSAKTARCLGAQRKDSGRAFPSALFMCCRLYSMCAESGAGFHTAQRVTVNSVTRTKHILFQFTGVAPTRAKHKPFSTTAGTKQMKYAFPQRYSFALNSANWGVLVTFYLCINIVLDVCPTILGEE